MCIANCIVESHLQLMLPTKRTIRPDFLDTPVLTNWAPRVNLANFEEGDRKSGPEEIFPGKFATGK